MNRFFRTPILVLLLALMFVVTGRSVRAADSTVSLTVAFASIDFVTVPVGRMLHLDIQFLNSGPHAIRATRLQCSQEGTSLRASSISRLPNSGVFAPNASFETEQLYQTVAPGTTSVTCMLKAVDLATGAELTILSDKAQVDVSGETRLFATAYSSTRTATVGQAIFMQVVYGNRGSSTLTNVQVQCSQLGRGIVFVSQRQNMMTLRPGESGFEEIRLQGVFHGASGLILCDVTATDSRTHDLIKITTGVPLLIV